jgi:Cu/Ag efflux protein CusF
MAPSYSTLRFLKNMKLKILFSLLVTLPSLLAASAKNGGCECGKGEEVSCCVSEAATTKAAEAVKRFPLQGVITAVDVERSSLMVKHEAIPGVMRAMTMLFKVDAVTLESAQKGQAITAMMSRQGNEWWLHDVKIVATPARDK